MPKTLARNRAIGAIGPGAVKKLEDAGLLVVDRDEWEKVIRHRNELEAEVRRLRNEVEAAQVPREAMMQ